MTNTATGTSKVVYEEKNRNVLAPQWSPRGDRIIFSIGEFGAFFDGFHELFLKPADRVEGGAQIAIVNPDGTGFEELTAGSGITTRSLRSRPMASASCSGLSRTTATVCAS